MRRLAILSMFVVLFVSVSFSAPQAMSVQAASTSISDGCYFVNVMGSAAVGRFINFTNPLAFRAGDVIKVSQQGSDWLFIYDISAGKVRATDKTASISWKVPANDSLKLWIGDNTLPKESRKAIVTITCAPAALPPSPVPSPTPKPSVTPMPTLVQPPAGATVLGFCQPNGGLYVYALGPTPNTGSLAFMVSPAEFAKVSTHPSTETVIKTGGGATLTRLTNGMLKLSRPNASGYVYSYTFKDCSK